jgi:DNA-binding XRE family transcriptional regulator
MPADIFRFKIGELDWQSTSAKKSVAIRDGIQDPLKVWSGILIDGHNRYEIATRHGLNFKTIDMQFNSRDDAIIWIIKNQFGRRNLSAYDRSILALKLKPVIAAKAKENQGERTDLTSVRNLTNVDTKKEIAKAAGVSHDTIAKVEKIEQQASPEIKAALKSGDISINQAFKDVKRAEKAQHQQEIAERKAYTPPTELPTDSCNLICADIRDGIQGNPNMTVINESGLNPCASM